MGNIFERKNAVLIIAAWFIVSYLILWFIGGACTNPINGSGCLMPNSIQGFTWNSLMYFLAPITGFIFAFILINWWNGHFDTMEAAGIGFVVLILIAFFAGYAINLWFYVGEAARLNSGGNVHYNLYFCFSETTSQLCNDTVGRINQELISQAQASGAQSVSQFIPVDYWGEIRRSMFLLFVLGAIAAWVPHFVFNWIESRKEN